MGLLQAEVTIKKNRKSANYLSKSIFYYTNRLQAEEIIRDGKAVVFTQHSTTRPNNRNWLDKK